MLRFTCLTLVLPGSAAAVQQAAGPADSSVQARDGRRPIHDFAGTVKALGRDFWLTFSAPVRMNTHDWLVTAGVLAAGGLIFWADEDITRAALRNQEEPGFKQVEDVGTFLEPVGLMGNTNIWYASAAVLSYAVGWERPNRMFTELLYSHWIAGLIRGGTNKLVGRSRPYSGAGAYAFKVGRGTSFPSGHASTAIQVATVLSHHVRSTPVSVALYGLAGTVAWQRITSEEHWASDVWLGAAYGWAVARLVIRLHEEDAVRLEPTVVPSGDPGLGLRFRF
jgi:membrane-associated phospholipid phosphatase